VPWFWILCREFIHQKARRNFPGENRYFVLRKGVCQPEKRPPELTASAWPWSGDARLGSGSCGHGWEIVAFNRTVPVFAHAAGEPSAWAYGIFMSNFTARLGLDIPSDTSHGAFGKVEHCKRQGLSESRGTPLQNGE
jgi:hypothetical protein